MPVMDGFEAAHQIRSFGKVYRASLSDSDRQALPSPIIAALTGLSNGVCSKSEEPYRPWNFWMKGQFYKVCSADTNLLNLLEETTIKPIDVVHNINAMLCDFSHYISSTHDTPIHQPRLLNRK